MNARKRPGRNLRRHAARTPSGRIPNEYLEQVQRWIIRLALHPFSSRDFFSGRPSREEASVLSALGIPAEEEKQLNRPAVLNLLESHLSELDRAPVRKQGVLYRNIEQLSKLLDLSPPEQEILAFLALLHDVRALSAISETLGPLSIRVLCEVLAEVLELTPADVRHALRTEGALIAGGLVIRVAGQCELPGKLDVLLGLSDILLNEHEDLLTMFGEHFHTASGPQLTLGDYSHLREDIAVLLRVLASAMAQRTCGINVLVYGPSGTGKTEFVKALTCAVNGCLYEVSHEYQNDEATRPQRFQAYQLCQRVLAKAPHNLVLFDEIEDVFPRLEFFGLGASKQSGDDKAWTNRLLESNPVPTFWLSNEVGQIDPAFLRRFTYCIEFRTPPPSVRRRILEQAARGLPVTKEWTAHMATNRNLTPAQITQACKVAHLAGVEEARSVEQLMERVVRNSLRVMGKKVDTEHGKSSHPARYSLEFLNPSQDLSRLTESLKQQARGRLCLYGPPGAGKTAFAHYVAEQLDKPVLAKRASDLLSMWVGGTEANLAEMFQEARSEEAVLLLDEADSFLQDRQEARRSWEITQVNELLVQMENFEGLFICSTNLMDTLDEAVFRRFDVKIRFGYLQSEQVWKLFLKTLEAAGCQAPDPQRAVAWQRQLAQLDTLTPGDFATILRQARLLAGVSDGEHLVAALQDECQVKLRGRKLISGFAR